MPYQFGEYEMVRLKDLPDAPPVGVRDWDATGTVYELAFPNDEEIYVHEDDLETTGEFEAPFRFYEVVEIYPDLAAKQESPEAASLIGKRGVVTGISAKYGEGHWGFSVDIENGKCWFFHDYELKPTGIILSEEQVDGPVENRVIVRLLYDPITEEETVLEGDASLLNRGPKPLGIDLDAL